MTCERCNGTGQLLKYRGRYWDSYMRCLDCDAWTRDEYWQTKWTRDVHHTPISPPPAAPGDKGE